MMGKYKLSDIFSRYTYNFDILNLKYYCVLYSFEGLKFSSTLSRDYNFEKILTKPWYSDIVKSNGNIVWQINPHFIHNTLTSIRCLVSMKKNEHAEDMLLAFMRLLKMIFRQNSEFIKISEELNCIKDYVIIQKNKYPDSFEMIYEIDDEIDDYMVPKLMLQPIIENAIFHGIKPQKNGIIQVTASKDGANDIVFMIIDNGVGMSHAQIEEIMNNQSNQNSFTGIGIPNVNERLKLYFGDPYGVSIESEICQGTVVKLRIPIII